MTALIIVGIVVASLVAYLGVGWALAKRDLVNAWARARRDWYSKNSIRASVKTQTVAFTLLWPFVAPIRAFSTRLESVVTRGDPAELRRQLADRERHIANLERELGIGRTAT